MEILSGLLGLLIFVLDVVAIVQILQSRESGPTKLVWVLVILLLPVLGLLIWFFAGPRAGSVNARA